MPRLDFNALDVPSSFMGHRSLDRIKMSQWRAKCETVGQMFEAGWLDVQAACGSCHRRWPVSISRVATERGADTSLWNRTQRCPMTICKGSIRFELRIPGLHHYQPMVAGKFVPRETEGQRAKRQRREGG
jgi:hypothetical protein